MYTEYHGLKEEDLNKLLFSVNFWEYERYWVDFQQNNRELLKNEEGEYRRFVLPHFALDDGVPLSLKAILFNRFAHWHSGYGDVIQEFKKWYANY
ncbi:hypothetical protein [Tannerella forsythia]|uniref:hypothetical protein n=1 Tax=Tannerella forsythia TaxID=28112 RepID=UPI0028E8BDE5|nr:hypothetical protein [Tannerella forsythia]